MAGVARMLVPGGLLYRYGPFKVDARHTAESNAAFDEGLRARKPGWGVRDLGEIGDLAASFGLGLVERIAMPANRI